MRVLRHIWVLGGKELLLLSRDLVLLLFFAYAFTIDVYMSGEGLGIELRDAAVAVADEDHSPLSRRLIESLRAPWFQPPEPIAARTIADALDSGRYTFALTIPPHFQADLLAGRRPAIQLIVDATAVSQAYVGTAYIQRIMLEELTRYISGGSPEIALPVEPVIRVRYNPNRESPWYEGLNMLLHSVTMISMLLPAIALMREREHGTIEHLLAMPLSAFTILASKVWSSMVVVLLGLSLGLVAILRVAFGMPFAGSPWLFYAGTILFLFGTAGLGILIATVARNTPQTALLALLVMMPMIFLSGAYTPEESMPSGLRQAMVISPLKYYTQFATGLVFRGAGLDTLWPDLAAMAAIGAFVFGLATLRFRAWFAAAQR